MNMKSCLYLLVIAVTLNACRGAENKADTETKSAPKTEPPAISVDSPNRIPPPAPSRSGDSRSSIPTAEPGDILAKIDDHLVSSSDCEMAIASSIPNCTIKVTNSLPDVTFEKAMLEITQFNAEGTMTGRLYKTLINLDPGRTVTVPGGPLTAVKKIKMRIVKVKSTQLTKGEWVLTGSEYKPA